MPQETSNYPGSLDVLTDQEAKKDKASKSVINRIQNIIEAIEAELGTDPAGSATDLKTRLYVCIDNDGALRKGTSFPASPIEGQSFYRTDEDQWYIYNGSAWKLPFNAPKFILVTNIQAVATSTPGGGASNADTVIDTSSDWDTKKFYMKAVLTLDVGAGGFPTIATYSYIASAASTIGTWPFDTTGALQQVLVELTLTAATGAFYTPLSFADSVQSGSLALIVNGSGQLALRATSTVISGGSNRSTQVRLDFAMIIRES